MPHQMSQAETSRECYWLNRPAPQKKCDQHDPNSHHEALRSYGSDGKAAE